MRHVRIRITDELGTHLDRRAAATGKAVATVILDLIEEQRAADEKQRRIDVALAALDKPAFNSGLPDLAENHDEYIGQLLDEEVERWRRG
jgi:hypothetical protein